MRARFRILLVPLALASLFIQAPANAMKLGSATSQFDSATQESVKILRDFYQSLNDIERSAYIEKAIFDPTKKIGFIENKEKTGLNAKYAPSALQARIAALQALAAYTRGLMQLSSDTPIKTIESDISSIGSKLIAINADFNSLAGQSGDNRIKTFSSPMASLAAIATKYWLSGKRDAALRSTISESGTQINTLFDLLEEDVNELQQGVIIRTANSSMGRYLDFYNNKLRQADLEGDTSDSVIRGGRLQFIQELKTAAIRYTNLEATNPVGVIKKMRAVHNSLVNCARNKNVPKSEVTSLLVDVESYALEANRVLSAWIALKTAIEH